MTNVAIFASGNGSNAQNIAEYFSGHPKVRISLILSNKKDAFVLERAKNLGIPAISFDREDIYHSDRVMRILGEYDIGFIVLAGFLWKVPDEMLKAYSGKIINIHPALLPKFGGKGMYGAKVHEAVVAAGEKRTGITIHFVNEHYDAGAIIFQESFPIAPADTPDSIAARVHELEYKYFPGIIEKMILGMENGE